MYLDYFGLSKLPFTISPDPEFLFPSVGHQEALAHLQYALTGHGGLIALTGEVGAGKTTLCRAFIESLPDHVHLAYIFNPQLSPIELLQTICDELQISYQPTDTLKHLYNHLNSAILQWYAEGHKVICLIDEAQVMSPVVLEQIRLLTNLETDKEKLISLVLVGQPELRDVLARHELRQLNQRITARYHLNLLSQQECRQYLSYRVSQAGSPSDLFVRQAADQIWQAAHGIPRLINSIADRALLGAFATSSAKVSVKIARQAIIEVIGQEARIRQTNEAYSHHLIESKPVPGWLKATSFIAGTAVSVAVALMWLGPVDVSVVRTMMSKNTTIDPIIDTNSVSELSNGLLVSASPTSGSSLVRTPSSPLVTSISAEPVSMLTQLLGLPDVGCDQITEYNYRCVRVSWMLDELRQLNHPVAVKTLNGDWKLLSSSLTGSISEALVLWQPPQGYTGLLRPGDRGQVINWVRQKLGVSWSSDWASIGPSGQQISIDESFYDPILAVAVENFQKQNRLVPDQTIGPQTILYLQRNDT